ncbi:hypothetical protein HDV06_004339 [Boothiomyces sp. JEL0866]|nr:hypothetical protein HDV06_004339 [Boothiomyces sp. JEL0866]
MRDDYSGKWKDNDQLSDSKELIMKLNEVPWLLQKALQMVPMTMEIFQSESKVIVRMAGAGITREEEYVWDNQEHEVQLPFGPPHVRKVYWEENHLVVEQRCESKKFSIRASWSVEGDVQYRDLMITLSDGQVKHLKMVMERVHQ